MHPTEETQRLVKAAGLEEKLQQPENQLNTLRLLQALTIKEIYSTKRQLDTIESDFTKLQEANVAGGSRNECIERQLEELRGDRENFRLLISEAEATTQNTKDGLEGLRTKVSDEYFKLTADNARFGKDIKTLNKYIDHHREKLCTVEKALESYQSKLPRSQEISKINETLARVEPLVKSIYEKLDTVSKLTHDQKEALAETINDQAQIRRFLDAFIPKQESFFRFLEKLADVNSSTMPSEFPRAGANEGDYNQLMNLSSSGPHPPQKAVLMLEQYNHFSNSYRIKRPKSEAKFIRQFLKKIDHRAAWLIQMKLQQDYPELVETLEQAETSNKTDVMIFLNMEKLSWNHVKIVMRRINGKELFSILETTEDEELGICLPRYRPEIEIL
ncbi:hypothetical protein F4804DRAFT_347454 [Jackrogersella minutella]|nr:hypothetical protein F4804DRAFT_347454 [Jackrogersella minutella]